MNRFLEKPESAENVQTPDGADVVIISVVRDFAMYDKCIRDNPHCAGCILHPVDNRALNEGIPTCYNRAIAARPADENAWYVFCHEDFQPLENLRALLARVVGRGGGQDSLWGPIGVAAKRILGVYFKWEVRGAVLGCSRRGENEVEIGAQVPLGTEVETYDCLCVIAHSSMLRRTGLRFDENLTFDLYAEDLCIAAKERHGVSARILPMLARHWSDSVPQPRYYRQLEYLNRKWTNCSYMGVFTWCIGSGFGLRKINAIVKAPLLRVWGFAQRWLRPPGRP